MLEGFRRVFLKEAGLAKFNKSWKANKAIS
jgi:hypothetical protein